ncbi:restriction endonuclease subunit S [Spongiivirga sp. MCCC 1A20706]|uniref:restriction endonuclease subunit S n=1 Tax=Spongiivirga sp. MCCC 1A20706 TaxID=3160963 RepID=UPI00397785EE
MQKTNIIHSNEVVGERPGYKHTKIGWIPNDWEIFRFDEVFQFIPTYSFSRNQLTKTLPNDKDVFNIHYGDIHTSFQNEQLDFDKDIEVASLVNSTMDLEKFKLLQEGDLVIADASEDYEGICDSVELKNVKNRKIIGGLHTFAVRDNSGLTANGYRGFIFKNEKVKHNLKRVATGISVLGVSKSNISKILIPLPPAEEQVVISKALLKWDTAITKLGKLIKAKQKRKKGLMQQLLTGKKRLPGFYGEWEKTGAGNIFKSISVKNKPLERLLSVTQDKGVIPREDLDGRVTMPSGKLDSFKLVDKGNFVISLRSFQGGLEYSEYKGLVSPAYTVLQEVKEIDQSFYKYYFKSYEFIERLSIAVIGIRDGKQISYSDFCTVKIPNIKLKEQKAISQVLATADKEIQLLQEQLEQMELQKKGMMQQLLTGKKRLINN